MATIDEIKQQAEAVKNASHVGENTALRVGGVLVDLCECMKNLSGGGTSGGSGVSLGTLLTKLNSENPFPTASGQVLTYNGSNFVWKAPTGSGGTSGGGSGGSLKPLEVVGKDSSTFFVYNGETRYRLRFGSGLSMKLNVDEYVVTADGGSGVTLNPTMTKMNEQLTKTTLNTPQFLYWTGTTYTWKNESEISGGSGGSIQVAQTPEYSGESESWVSTTKLRFVGITGTKPTIRTNSEKSCVDVGIPVGSGSGSSGTTSGKLRFYQDSSEETWNGESDFKIIFGSGLNVTWDSHSQITLSATGGSSGGSSGSVSWADVTNKPSTFTPSSHSHSTNDINGLNSYVQGTKVNKAGTADRLANVVTLWGNNFSGSNSIGTTSSYADLRYVKDIYARDVFDIKAGNNSLLKVDGTPSIYVGFGYMANNKASLLLFGNKTTIYTSGDDYRYDFKGGVFDVNTNTIHFGPEAGGGKISWDRANNAFKIEGNLYSTGGITALGVSNSATTSNNVDFTFKSVTANTFNVKDSIQISDKLVLNRDHDDVYLASSSIGTYYMYLDGNDKNYYLTSNGDAHFNNLSCDYLDIPGAESFKIVDVNSTTFTIQFQYNGKTYEFTPSDSEVSVS